MIRKKHIVTALALVACIGCEQASQKTDSMVRRDAADTEYQALIDKAQALTSPTTFSEPVRHLSELIIIQNLVAESKAVYKDARILHWDDSDVEALESRLQSINQPLALASLDAFSTALDMSLTFKKKKTDVESLPVSDNTLAKQALLTHLKTFNAELDACCVEKITLINRFLSSEKEKYFDVIKLGHNTLHYMGMLIRGEITEQALRNKIASQRHTITELASLSADNQSDAKEHVPD
ncbi:hypothetical protein [Alteromonas halophila]|uniref:Uncharacterized protein n=1 Tax=Alteromonas halophila TaxID=516698 RepID=A0A918JN62_9ALTE|nr:hypothetical protein [Alteromonas halophila]GGW88599.1 hypothetical protein GCM10007391_23390 [Alteromonas halophila]